MTPERIAELRALADKATPGPWTSGGIKGGTEMILGPEITEGMARETRRELALVKAPVENQRSGDCAPNTAFIVAARTALPEALDEIERLQKMVSCYGCQAGEHERAEDGYDYVERGCSCPKCFPEKPKR